MPIVEPREPAAPVKPADWAEPGIGRNWQYRFFYWLMRLGGTIRGYHMAGIVSFGYVLFYPAVRRRCSYYLDRRFPERRRPLQRFWDTYRLVSTYAASLVDLMVVTMFGPAALTAVSPDHDQLYKLAQSERGFVLIQAHVGAWQIGMSTLTQFPKNVSVLTLQDARVTALFDSTKMTTIDPRSGLQGTMEMTEALLRGDIVVMMGDRTFGNQQSMVTAKFLGGDVLLPVMPFRLASAIGVPVVVMMAPKTGKRTYELRLSGIIEVPPGLGRHARAYEPYAQQFADCLERFVRDYPWQYYNFFNIWTDGGVVASPKGS